MVVSDVDGRVCAHEPHRRPDGLADRPRLGAHVMLQPAHDPESRFLLKNHEPQSL
jgi:hypothetical protein